jgi:hypothetical protein
MPPADPEPARPVPPPPTIGRRRFLALGGAASLVLVDACSSGGSTKPPAEHRFTDDFRRPPGPLGNGWTDAHFAVPRYEDRVGIVAGGVADISLQGSRDQDPSSSGWRGAFYRDFATPTGVRVATTVYLHPQQSTSGGGPLLHVVPGATDWAIGAWYDVGLGLDWYELGLVGRRPDDFRFLDTFTTPPPTRDGTFALEVRSVGGQVSLFADGHRVAGPVPLPASLSSSSLHGGQIDIGSRAEQGVAQIREVTLAAFSGPPTPDYGPAQLTPGPVASVAAGGDRLRLPLPSGVRAGDELVAFVALQAGVTATRPAGWADHGIGGAAGGPRVLCTATTSDGRTDPPVFTVAGGGIASGVVVRLAGANPHAPFTGTFSANPSSTAVEGRAQRLFGPHRAGLWVAAAPPGSRIAEPSGWSPLASGAGLCAASVADWGSAAQPVRPPYAAGGSPTAVPVGRLQHAGPSGVMTLTVLPHPTPVA